MKKILILIIITGITCFYACDPDQPSAPQLNLTLNQLALSKIVMVGNSLTAGYQSSGMLEDFQVNSYPNLLFQQVSLLTGATEFEQPLVAQPGIGLPEGEIIKTPMYLDNGGNITSDTLKVDPRLLLKTALVVQRPYDNLGVPGADLNDLLNTIGGVATNPWFDMILRNPNLGNTTQLQQVAMLNPTMVLLWAGCNDVLGAALDGGDLDQITPQPEFQSLMQQILTQLRNDLGSKPIIMANIPYVTDIPYINTLDPVFVGGIPVVFDANLQPFDFGGGTGLYLPLVTVETNVEHITLVGLGAYHQGLGIPDSAYMVDNLGMGQGQAKQLEDGMIDAGLTPTGLPLDGSMTLTASEASTIKAAVDGYNVAINTLGNTFQVPVVDANAALTELNVSGIDGATGKFVMVDPATTAFSLDGVHANDAGNAVVANEFIKVINTVLQLDTPIPEVNVSSKLGQYFSPGKMNLGKAITDVRELFRRNGER
jgi:lysophospholipase L1-like esterase